MASKIQEDMDAMEIPPSADVDRDRGPSRFTITFKPAPHLVIDEPTTFDVRVPMSYPSTPPLVSCLTPGVGAKVRGGSTTIDETGKVQLAILKFDGAWNRTYTLSHVTWALHVMLKRSDVPTVQVLPCPTPTSRRHTPQEAGQYGRRGHRGSMEDETCAFPKLSSGDGRVRPLSFYAVFDGHGGRRMAEYASKHLHKALLNAIGDGLSIPLALHRACVQTDEGFTAMLAKEADKDQSGTTACIVVVDGDTLYTGNLGDSRAVMSRGGQAVALTTDQKASSPSEVARIVAAEGFVINNRVLGYLAVARALGDSAFKANPGQPALVSTHPEVTQMRLDEGDEFMVVACDGLFDVMSNQEVVDFARPMLVKGSSPQDVAAGLSQAAIDRGSTDNVSVVVVIFGERPRGPAHRPSASSLSAGAGAGSSRKRASPDRSSNGSGRSPVRGRKGSTSGEIPAMLLALVAETEKAGPTDNPFSRSFGSTSQAAAARHKIVEDAGVYRGTASGADDRNGAACGAGAGVGAGGRSSGYSRPGALDLTTPGSRYDRAAASPRRPGMSPVVAQAARNRASSRERRSPMSSGMVTPKIASMSEERKRALSREGARLLESSGVLGTPSGSDSHLVHSRRGSRGSRRGSGDGAGFRRKRSSNKLDDGSDLMEFLLDDNNFDNPLS